MPTGKITPISNLVGKIDRGGGPGDHDKLINKDLADQHPIEAITGLLDALNQLDSKISTLDEKIDSEADFVASELNKIRTELTDYKEFVNCEFIKVYDKIETTQEGLEAEITNLQDQINVVEAHLDAVQEQIDDISIEELSKRDYYDPDESLDDRYELTTEFDPEKQYYEIVYDVDDNNSGPNFVPVILTEETYEPNKYYVLNEAPIAKIIRIELSDESSTYRDSLGNDVLKIVKNNVLLNGDILAPDLQVVNNIQTTIELENNAEKTFNNTINNLTITIPNTVKHGFTSYIVLESSASFSANIINNSLFNLRIIKAGAIVPTLDFENSCQYNLLFLCNGVNLELYVQEIVIE